MKIAFSLSLSVGLLILAGCASAPTAVRLPAPTNVPATPSGPAVTYTDNDDPSIDYVAIQRDLGLERDFSELGYAERPFDTCRVGYGYSSSKNCHRQYMVVIHFQLLCRDTEGTVSRALSSTDMQPLSGRPITWDMKGTKGILQTDARGFGQIRAVASVSQKQQRLKLTSGNDFLYMRAGEITRVVTPQPWCSP